jgi:hypothetical protein
MVTDRSTPPIVKCRDRMGVDALSTSALEVRIVNGNDARAPE